MGSQWYADAEAEKTGRITDVCVTLLYVFFDFSFHCICFHLSLCYGLCFPVGRQKFVRDILNAAPVVFENEDDAVKETLHFYKPSENNSTQEKQQTSSSAGKELGRCKSKKRPDGSERETPPAKRSSLFTAEDMDLLNSY